MASLSGCEADQFAGTSCETHLKVIKFSYTWPLHGFSMCPEQTGAFILSSNFSAPGPGNSLWRLVLYPNGINEECKDFVSLYLCRVYSYYYNEVLVEYKFAVLDEGGWEVHVGKATAHFAPGGCRGFPKFIERDCLRKGTSHLSKGGFWGRKFFKKRSCPLKGADRLLPNDKLTIYCEVRAFVDSINICSPERSVAVNVPDCQLSQDLCRLLESRRLSDVILTVQGKDIHAHKIILAARCPVFAAMFEHGMKEENEGRVEITDCDFEVLHEVVEFIYTGRAPKLNEMAEEVLVAANKYNLGRLKAMCEDILCLKLSLGTAAELLALADMHNADQLKANALRFIKTHGAEVLETDGWKMMASRNPQLIVEAFSPLVVDNVAPETGFGRI